MTEQQQNRQKRNGARAPRTRLALNGRFSGTLKPTGTQTVAFHLYDAILRQPRDFDLLIYADSRFTGVAAWKDAPGVEFVETPFSDWSSIMKTKACSVMMIK